MKIIIALLSILVLFVILMPKTSCFFLSAVSYCSQFPWQANTILDTDALFVLQAHSYLRLRSVLPTAIQFALECEERSSEFAGGQAHSSLVIYNPNFLARGSDYWMYFLHRGWSSSYVFLRKGVAVGGQGKLNFGLWFLPLQKKNHWCVLFLAVSSLMLHGASFIALSHCWLPYIVLHNILFLSVFNHNKGRIKLCKPCDPDLKTAKKFKLPSL